jgi:hypothetical protein
MRVGSLSGLEAEEEEAWIGLFRNPGLGGKVRRTDSSDDDEAMLETILLRPPVAWFPLADGTPPMLDDLVDKADEKIATGGETGRTDAGAACGLLDDIVGDRTDTFETTLRPCCDIES